MEKNMEHEMETGVIWDLGNFVEVTILERPYYLLCIHIMVTSFQLVNSNPDNGALAHPTSTIKTS